MGKSVLKAAFKVVMGIIELCEIFVKEQKKKSG